MEKWSGQFNSTQYPPGVASGQIEVDLQTNENGFVQSPGYTTSFKVNYWNLSLWSGSDWNGRCSREIDLGLSCQLRSSL